MVAKYREEIVINEATLEDQKEALDYAARRFLNISGPQFLERWDAGDYDDVRGTPLEYKVNHVTFFLPHGR